MLSFPALPILDSLLSKTPLTSTSEIIHFIGTHLTSTLNHSLQQLQERISEVQRPKGMDRVMIQEVKTIVQAMLEQKDMDGWAVCDRKNRENIAFSTEMNSPSTRTLHEIDTNVFQQHFPSSFATHKKTSMHFLNDHPPSKHLFNPHKTEQYANHHHNLSELQEMKEEMGLTHILSHKNELKEIKRSINNLQKDTLEKISFDQVEKLIMKFQKQIFIKMNQERQPQTQLQNRIAKIIDSNYNQLKQQLAQYTRNKPLLSKIQKKLKRYIEQSSFLRSDLQKNTTKIQAHDHLHKKYEDQQQRLLQDWKELHLLVEKVADEMEKIKNDGKAREEQQEHRLEEQEHRLELMGKEMRNGSGKEGVWMTAPVVVKNHQVIWQRLVSPSCGQSYQYQLSKSTIKIITPGFYSIKCLLYSAPNTYLPSPSSSKPPVLLLNSEPLPKFQANPLATNSTDILPRWQFSQIVYVKQNRSAVVVRIGENQENCGCCVLRIYKIV